MSNPLEKRATKSVVKVFAKQMADKQGYIQIPQLLNDLVEQGYTFGDHEELIEFAQKIKLRTTLGKIRDSNGKREFVATSDQLMFDFGTERIYAKPDVIKTEAKNSSLEWLRKHLIGLVRRTPLLPEWAIDRLITAIDEIFNELVNQ